MFRGSTEFKVMFLKIKLNSGIEIKENKLSTIINNEIFENETVENESM